MVQVQIRFQMALKVKFLEFVDAPVGVLKLFLMINQFPGNYSLTTIYQCFFSKQKDILDNLSLKRFGWCRFQRTARPLVSALLSRYRSRSRRLRRCFISLGIGHI